MSSVLKFTTNGFIAYVYPEKALVFVNGEMYPMTDVALFTPTKAKFSFSDFNVKILNSKMSLFSKHNNLLYKVLTREGESPSSTPSAGEISTPSEDRKFLISGDRYVWLTGDNTVKYDGGEYPVRDMYKRGGCMVYNTDVGILVVSSTSNRQSSWLGVYIQESAT
jgi:hypothetical protein